MFTNKAFALAFAIAFNWSALILANSAFVGVFILVVVVFGAVGVVVLGAVTVVVVFVTGSVRQLLENVIPLGQIRSSVAAFTDDEIVRILMTNPSIRKFLFDFMMLDSFICFATNLGLNDNEYV